MEHFSQEVRVAIEEDNPSVRRIEEKCVKCGLCVDVCNKLESVNNKYSLKKNGNRSVCVNCGQCIKVCPMDSLVIKSEYEKVRDEIKSGKIVIISTSPSVRVALGDEFNMEKGAFVQGKMVALLKKLGFKYVLDTNFAADLTICEEASELIERIKLQKNLPMFTSCCPAWVKFAETFYPEIIPNISSCKSPIGMQGALVKTYFAKKMGLNPSDIVHVALTPCVAKKFEIRRQEMNISAEENRIADMRDTDYCITTSELATWAKSKKIDLKALKDANFDKFMGEASGAGVIFGNSGGVMEAAVRTAYNYLTGEKPSEELLKFEKVRGHKAMKTAEVNIGDLSLKLAVVYGLKNARVLLDKIKKGEHFDMVEIMTCPGGCIGGGGQPKHLKMEKSYEESRIKSLYHRDAELRVRLSNENEEVTALYKEFLTKPNSLLAERLLHTKYFDRSETLGRK